jgi:hypothetical protein
MESALTLVNEMGIGKDGHWGERPRHVPASCQDKKKKSAYFVYGRSATHCVQHHPPKPPLVVSSFSSEMSWESTVHYHTCIISQRQKRPYASPPNQKMQMQEERKNEREKENDSKQLQKEKPK